MIEIPIQPRKASLFCRFVAGWLAGWEDAAAADMAMAHSDLFFLDSSSSSSNSSSNCSYSYNNHLVLTHHHYHHHYHSNRGTGTVTVTGAVTGTDTGTGTDRGTHGSTDGGTGLAQTLLLGISGCLLLRLVFLRLVRLLLAAESQWMSLGRLLSVSGTTIASSGSGRSLLQASTNRAHHLTLSPAALRRRRHFHLSSSSPSSLYPSSSSSSFSSSSSVSFPRPSHHLHLYRGVSSRPVLTTPTTSSPVYKYHISPSSSLLSSSSPSSSKSGSPARGPSSSSLTISTAANSRPHSRHHLGGGCRYRPARTNLGFSSILSVLLLSRASFAASLPPSHSLHPPTASTINVLGQFRSFATNSSSLATATTAASPSSPPATAVTMADPVISKKSMEPHRITDNLEKPLLDNRTYRVIELPNKVEVLLVHDDTTDKSSAALDVRVGSMCDDEELPGQAHAVEHVLFMGTKKVLFFFPSPINETTIALLLMRFLNSTRAKMTTCPS